MLANLKLGKFLTSFTKKKDQVLPKLEKRTKHKASKFSSTKQQGDSFQPSY